MAELRRQKGSQGVVEGWHRLGSLLVSVGQRLSIRNKVMSVMLYMCIKMRTHTLYIHHYPPRYSWSYMVYTWSILYYLTMKFRFLSTQQISAITVFEVGAYRSPPGHWEFSRRGPAQPLCLEFLQGLVRLSWCKGSMGLLYFVVYN